MENWFTLAGYYINTCNLYGVHFTSVEFWHLSTNWRCKIFKFMLKRHCKIWTLRFDPLSSCNNTFLSDITKAKFILDIGVATMWYTLPICITMNLCSIHYPCLFLQPAIVQIIYMIYELVVTVYCFNLPIRVNPSICWAMTIDHTDCQFDMTDIIYVSPRTHKKN